jgi:hypothetical protein
LPIEQQDEAGGETADSARPQQPAPPAKITVEGPITVINKPDPKEEERDAEQRTQTKFTNRVNLGTLLFAAIAALGAVGAYFANRRAADAAEMQAGLLKQQVEKAKGEALWQQMQAQRALSATQRSADAAKKSADIAELTLKTSQRARLHVVDIEFGPHKETKIATVVIRVVNSGQLPAAIIDRTITLWTDEPLPPYSSDVQMEWLPAAGVFPPTGNHPLVLQFPFPEFKVTPKEWQQIVSGQKRLSIYGAIRYETGFDDITGESGFAFTYDPTAITTEANKRFELSQEPGYIYAK